MAPLIAADISDFQPVVNDTYPRRWLTFRVCDGDYADKNARANLAWCKAALAAGKLDGFGVYVVYRPGLNGTILNQLDAIAVPTDCVVMVDVESWGGQIMGDRSTEINALCTALAKRQESSARVWGYANLNDYRTVWTTRPSWLGLVVASYGGQQPVSPGPGPLVGWQYTDGQYSEPGLPSSSQPFGPCDHNLILAEVDMPLTDADIARIWAYGLVSPTDNKPHRVGDYIVGTRVVLGDVSHLVTTLSGAQSQLLQAIQAAGGTVTDAQLEQALKHVLASLGTAP